MKSTVPKQRADIPQHIAIIMDGNGRWAQKRGLARHIGHEQGAKTTENIIRHAHDLGIRHVTLYAFSSENWRRPQDEIDAVMHILERYLREDANELIKNGIKMSAIGDIARLPKELGRAVGDVVKKTAKCDKLTITLALSYGAWEEITHAVKTIVADHKIDPHAVTEQLIKQHLFTKHLPDPDLLIRTGGEVRLSNFLLLQLSYSELYFCKTLWPDFQPSDLDLALKSFISRKRRFGGVE